MTKDQKELLETINTGAWFLVLIICSLILVGILIWIYLSVFGWWAVLGVGVFVTLSYYIGKFIKLIDR